MFPSKIHKLSLIGSEWPTGGSVGPVTMAKEGSTCRLVRSTSRVRPWAPEEGEWQDPGHWGIWLADRQLLSNDRDVNHKLSILWASLGKTPSSEPRSTQQETPHGWVRAQARDFNRLHSHSRSSCRLSDVNPAAPNTHRAGVDPQPAVDTLRFNSHRCVSAFRSVHIVIEITGC